MKRLLAVLMIALSTAVAGNAQNTVRHELSLGYGALVETDYLDLTSSILKAFMGVRESNSQSFGGVNVGYSYGVGRNFSVGCIGSYSYYASDVQVGDEMLGRERKNCFALMPTVKYCWLNRAVRLYSYVAAGAIYCHSTLASQSDNAMCFAFQFTPIGFETGRKWAYYMEIGVGQAGTFSTGLRYRF